MNWINLFGLGIILVMLIPNILYSVKRKGERKPCENIYLNVLEQIGRYGSMFLLVFPIGLTGTPEFGFHSVTAMLIYMAGNAALLLAYLIFWIPYFKHPTRSTALALAILPSCIFILSGLTLRHYLLVLTGVIFAVGHIAITWQTHTEVEEAFTGKGN